MFNDCSLEMHFFLLKEHVKRHLWVLSVVVIFSGQPSKATLALLKFEITKRVYFIPVSCHPMFFSHKIKCNVEPPSKEQLFWNHNPPWSFSGTFAAYFQKTLSYEHHWRAASARFWRWFSNVSPICINIGNVYTLVFKFENKF